MSSNKKLDVFTHAVIYVTEIMVSKVLFLLQTSPVPVMLMKKRSHLHENCFEIVTPESTTTLDKF